MASDPDHPGITVSASEVHDYFYCPYRWWLTRVPMEPVRAAMLKAGTRYHRHDVAGLPSARARRWGRVLFFAAVALAVAAVVALMVGY